MGEVHAAVKEWLEGQPDWVSHAFTMCRAGTDSEYLADALFSDRCGEHGVDPEGLLATPAGTAASTLATNARAPKSTPTSNQLDTGWPGTGTPQELRQISAVDSINGINRLGPSGALTFGRGLTVLYGANGAGKSGYVRLFETACGSPHAEQLLPDVFDEDPPPPEATLTLAFSDDREQVVPFKGDAIPTMSAVESFNLRYREHVLRQRDEVTALHGGLETILALRPVFGKAKENLAQHPAAHQVVPEFEDLAGPHEVGTLIASLGATSEVQGFRDLASLAPDDIERTRELRARRADDTARADRSRHLRSVAEALETHVIDLSAYVDQLTVDHLRTRQEAAQGVVDARSTARQLASTLHEHSALEGAGTSAWRELWKAAAQFSHTHAYLDQPFPVTGDDARCVLCMQSLSGEEGAVERMDAFAAYMEGVGNTLLSEAEQTWRHHAETLKRDVLPLPQLINDELETNHATQHAHLTRLREDLELATDVLVEWTEETDRRLVEGTDSEEVELLPWGPAPFAGEPGRAVLSRLEELAISVKTTARDLQDGLTADESAELAALEARHALRERLDEVEAAIAQHQLQARLEKVKNDLGSHRLTAAFNDLVGVVLDEPQRARFRRELDALNLDHLQVARPIRADKAVAWTQTALDGAQARAQVTQVISSGEQNGVAIAAFLSHLSDDGQTPVLLDDPVSAMDDRTRDRVAERLARLSKSRQVIVFTHDPFFCTKLLKQARWQGVDHSAARLFRVGRRAGLVDHEGPFYKGKVNARLGSLRAQAEEIVDAYAKGETNAPDRAAEWMGKLRAAWESIIEDVILAGVVRRYQAEVDVAGLNKIVQVEPELAELAASEYRRCHPDITAHDDGIGAGEATIESSEVCERLRAIEQFVASLRDA